MKDIIKIILLLIVLIAMVGGFWYLFKDQKVFEHKKKEEVKVEQKIDSVDEVKEDTEQEGTKENIEKEAEAPKKKETTKTENKTTTKTETKQDSSTQKKEETNNENTNQEMVIKSYSKPRCVFSGEADNYNYIMTYVGYFDRDNNNLMDKVNIYYQYAPKSGKLEEVKKEAQDDIKEHDGFSGGYKIQDGYVLVNLDGNGKAFSKVYLEGSTEIVNMDTFTYIMKSLGATCYNA